MCGSALADQVLRYEITLPSPYGLAGRDHIAPQLAPAIRDVLNHLNHGNLSGEEAELY